MEEIRAQVSRARRRLVMQHFLRVATWWLFAALLMAVVGVSATKIWVMPVDKSVWLWSWFGGAGAVGLLGAGTWTYLRRRGSLDAAIEIDRRCGLKERVSTTLSLAPDELDTEVGQALADDARRRVAGVNVKEQFPIRAGWQILLPLVPAMAVFAIALLLPDAVQQSAEAASSTKAQIEIAKQRQENLKKRLRDQKQRLEQKGLKDAEAIFKQIDESLGAVDENKDGVSQKKALVKLKELEKKLGERRDIANSANELKKQLQNLRSAESGPAEDLSKAMQQGDFKGATKALEDLAEKIREGKLTKEQKEQLTKQLQQIQQNLQQMAQRQQEAKQQLENKIQQMKQQGNQQAVEQLQQQLDQLAKQDQMMQQMQQMSQMMQEAADAMQQGDQQQAAQQLGQMMQQFENLQDQLDDLESLDQLLDQLSDARNSMNCSNCKGAGCSQCMGSFGNGSQGMGDGLGEGQGRGERPEEQSDTGTYLSKVGAKPQAGESVLKGYTSGPNLPGVSREEVKSIIQQNIVSGTDSISDQRLPKDQRDHALEYFQRRRK